MNKHSIIAVDDNNPAGEYERRAFLRLTASMAGLLGFGALLSSCGSDDDETPASTTPAPAPPQPTPITAAAAVTDQDVLNFALVMNYVSASFHSVAFTGSPLASSLTGGTGTQGTAAGGRRVSFTTPAIASYAEEIQQREVQHVTQLRTQLAANAAAMPAIDIGTGSTGAFGQLSVAGGLTVNGQSFDPYASEDNYLLGAFFLQDLMVTAFKSAIRILPTRTLSEAFAGMLATKSYHAGLLRALLIRRGLQNPALRTATDTIARYRDRLDGPSVTDRGVSPVGDRSSIVATDVDGAVFGRTVGQVLNVAFMNSGAVRVGGFFPAGVPGVFATSGYGYVERFDPALDALIDVNAVVEEVVGEFNWIEGPVWVGGADGYLLTSHPRDTFITRYNSREGSSIFVQPSGLPPPIDPLLYAEPGSNGLFLGRGGLLVADGGLRSVRVLDLQTKTFRLITDRFEGKKYNSPNDFAVSPKDGAIFFTDPAYGLRGALTSPLREMDYTGVFRIAPDNTVTLIGKYDRPNGIGVSPDGNTLYFTDVTRGWIAVTLDANGRPSNEREFISRTTITGGDGFKIDRAGNMWASYANGITIVTPAGKRLGNIRVNDTAANCEIGQDGYLYIASNRRLARIKVNAQKLLIPQFS